MRREPRNPARGLADLKSHLDALYARYNKPEFIPPDPLQCVTPYRDTADREIAGLVASSLAFGNVKQILASVDRVLGEMREPASWLRGVTQRQLQRRFAGFRHRYVTGADLADLLWGAKLAIENHGSLEGLFHRSMSPGDATVLPALSRFCAVLCAGKPRASNYLIPSPDLGSACKRWHMYLRWMVRCDEVDPGGWKSIDRSRLIVPVDTHMHRIARRLGLTARNAADQRTALEITAAFRMIEPDDPVRFDFALTRLGIRKDPEMAAFLELCGNETRADARVHR